MFELFSSIGCDSGCCYKPNAGFLRRRDKFAAFKAGKQSAGLPEVRWLLEQKGVKFVVLIYYNPPIRMLVALGEHLESLVVQQHR